MTEVSFLSELFPLNLTVCLMFLCLVLIEWESSDVAKIICAIDGTFAYKC